MAKQKKQKKEQVDYKDLLQRTQANFENYRKQQEKRIIDIREMAAKDIVLQVLPIIDNLELALKNNTCENTDFVEGIELIYSQFHSLLENNHLKTIETKNKMFDPFYHEALMKVDSELPENTIVEELQKGFTLHDKVIRHTKVKISNGKNNTNSEE
tara:strand:- start:866 stop:1333 length:468 start_codon:yes stop_codon:yes gene_type:complete